MGRKKQLLPDQKTMSATLVDEAREWAVKMVRFETRDGGDLSRAMARVARRCGVTPSLIWSLHYRPPKDIWASVYFKLHAAYRAECARQANLFDHELKIAAATAGTDAPFVRAARALAGSDFRAGVKPDSIPAD